MKTINIIPVLLVVLMLLVQSSFASDARYEETMKKNIQAVYTAQTLPEIQNAVNALERIGSAEKSKWEPYYYAGFGYIMMAIKENEAGKKDQFLDQAVAAIEKGKALRPNDSELITLDGFAQMIRVSVDPASRGAQYAGLASATFQKAITLNPENPRALAMLAQMELGTAKFFGSAITDACATADKALAKFNTFMSDNPLAPMWGKSTAEELKKQCH